MRLAHPAPGKENEMTLLEKVLYPYEFQARKHELGEDYAENEVNRMTNVELLRAISEALEELWEQ